jgi:hypothetical protein
MYDRYKTRNVTRTENLCAYVCVGGGGALKMLTLGFGIFLYTVVKLDSVSEARKLKSDFKGHSL